MPPQYRDNNGQVPQKQLSVEILSNIIVRLAISHWNVECLIYERKKKEIFPQNFMNSNKTEIHL